MAEKDKTMSKEIKILLNFTDPKIGSSSNSLNIKKNDIFRNY